MIKNVDDACDEIRRREGRINVLCVSAGYLTLQDRSETSEGLDRKMCVNYYGRMRFIHNLLPQLNAAADAKELARVVTILAAGSEAEIKTDDLDLRHSFTVHLCLAHCVVMTDFMVEELGRRHPNIAFSHSFPGTVKSGITNQLSGPTRLAIKVLYAVSSPWIIDPRENGERHLFQITSGMFPAKSVQIPLVAVPEGFAVCKGSDGTPGSGAYLLDWDASATGDQRVLQKYREEGLSQKIWDHTLAMFDQALSRRQPSPPEEAPQPERVVPRDPVGWRSA